MVLIWLSIPSTTQTWSLSILFHSLNYFVLDYWIYFLVSLKLIMMPCNQLKSVLLVLKLYQHWAMAYSVLFVELCSLPMFRYTDGLKEVDPDQV
jgi:hypothetical protein